MRQIIQLSSLHVTKLSVAFFAADVSLVKSARCFGCEQVWKDHHGYLALMTGPSDPTWLRFMAHTSPLVAIVQLSAGGCGNRKMAVTDAEIATCAVRKNACTGPSPLAHVSLAHGNVGVDAIG